MDINEQIIKEKQYLENVKDVIYKELEKDNEMIVKIPHEYKGRYADTKWGDDDLVQDLTKMYQKRINVLTELDKKPYFGSFDFENTNRYTKKYRIGKVNVSDKNNNQLVLDWRSPICSIYYDKNMGSVTYMAPTGNMSGTLKGKTQIIIENGELIDIQNVDYISNDELLKPYLNVNADNRMKIIIASIQTEQNKIIRESGIKDLLVQGVAGSGKTSVALHRIAYLLYADENIKEADKYLIIGPNKYFLNYASSILPDLDTQDVNSITFEDFASTIINEKKYKITNASDEINDYLQDEKDGKIKKLKGSIIYINMLNNFVKDYFKENLKGDILYNDVIIFSEDEYINRLNYECGYIDAINMLISRLIKKGKEKGEKLKFELLSPLMEFDNDSASNSKEREDIRTQMADIQKKIKNGFSNEIKNHFKPLLISPLNLYINFLQNIEKYAFDYDKEIINTLKVNTMNSLKKKIIPYEDLAAIMHLTKLSTNINDYKTFKQIVVDEAQDYSLFQFLTLKEWFSGASFSIFGDLAQTLCPYRSINSWEEVNNYVFNSKAETLQLNKSYRTTKQITDNANNILDILKLNKAEPVIRIGEEVSFIDSSDNQETLYINLINNDLAKGYKSIGIICKDNNELNKISKELSEQNIDFNIITNQNTEYYGGISLLTSFSAKGLEFDSVIITNASNEKYDINNNLDMHLLYVACTRALHKLHIRYDKDLCECFKQIKN